MIIHEETSCVCKPWNFIFNNCTIVSQQYFSLLIVNSSFQEFDRFPRGNVNEFSWWQPVFHGLLTVETRWMIDDWRTASQPRWCCSSYLPIFSQPFTNVRRSMAPQLSGSLQTYLKYFNDSTLEIFKKTVFFLGGWGIKRLRWKSARLLILPLLFSKTNVYLFIYMFAKPYFPETVVSFFALSPACFVHSK